MSYDVSFCVKIENVDDYFSVGHCNANIIYNVWQLIRESSGWDIKNGVGELLTELIPKIRNGLNELTNNPNKYRNLESPNKWGTISGVKQFYHDILFAYTEFKEDYPRLVEITRVIVC